MTRWVTVAWGIVATVGAQGAACRDRFLQPFAVDSVWNTAIGSGAQFVPAGIFAADKPQVLSFHNDQGGLVQQGVERMSARAHPGHGLQGGGAAAAAVASVQHRSNRF